MIPPLSAQPNTTQILQPAPQSVETQPRAFTPWFDLPVLVAILIYLVKTILPRFVDHNLEQATADAEAERNQEATITATVLATLIKLVETSVQHQNALMAGLLNSHQRLAEDSEHPVDTLTLQGLTTEVNYLAREVENMVDVMQELRLALGDRVDRREDS